MENVISFLIVACIVAGFAYFKIPAVKNFIDSKLGRKPEKAPESTTTPLETIFPPVSTPAPTEAQKPVVEPVRTPEALVGAVIPTIKPVTKEPKPVSDPVPQWPVGLPVSFSADNTGHVYPMYYDVPLNATTNLVVDEWFKGIFQILMTANQNYPNPAAVWTVNVRDLHQEGAPVVGSVSASSSGNFTMNIKPTDGAPARRNPQDVYLAPGSYRLDFLSSASGSRVLVTIAEFTK